MTHDERIAKLKKLDAEQAAKLVYMWTKTGVISFREFEKTLPSIIKQNLSANIVQALIQACDVREDVHASNGDSDSVSPVLRAACRFFLGEEDDDLVFGMYLKDANLLARGGEKV